MHKSAGYKEKTGSASQFALISILSVIIITSGLFILLGGMQRITTKEKFKVQTDRGFQDTLYVAISDIIENEGPESDSYFDLYADDYNYNKNNDLLVKDSNGYKVSIREHSGKLSLNVMHWNLIKNTKLGSLFKPGVSEYAFKDFQAEHGFLYDIDDFDGLFNSQDDKRHFTVYGYANFNICPDNAFFEIGTARCMNAATGESIKSISDQFRSRLKLAEKSDFNMRVYTSYPEVYPMLNLEPVLNINFATEAIIRAICSYPYGEHKIPNNQNIAEKLISLRNTREILPDELEKLIPTQKEYPAQKRIFQYFGTLTWFWEIIIEKDNHSAHALLARIPEHDSDNTSYRLVEFIIN
jgi:hypothetical protein